MLDGSSMRNVLTIVTALSVLCAGGCAGNETSGGPVDSPDGGMTGDPPPPPPPPPPSGSVAGTWNGSFTTDSSLASKGDFSFSLTEDAAHAVTGPFTGTVTSGASGTAFKGTFTGTRSGTTLNGTVAVTEPAGVSGTFAFQPASISGDTIAGAFNIDVKYSGIPVTAKGNYSIKRAP